MDIERYNFWEIETKPFEVDLWDKVMELRNKGKDQSSLVLLYGSLLDALDSPVKCNNFIGYIMDKDLTSDIIVHVVNALDVIQEHLPQWESFTRFCSKELYRLVGERASRLIKAFNLPSEY